MISIHPNIVERAIDSISCDFNQKEALQKIKNYKKELENISFNEINIEKIITANKKVPEIKKEINDNYKDSSLGKKILKILGGKKKEIKSFPEIVNELRDLKSQIKKDINYLDKILQEFEIRNFMSISPSEIKEVKNNIGKIESKYVSEKIQNILGYGNKRSSIFPKIFQKIGIKTCVYCNGQSTITIGEDKISARYQLDHYYPESKYPYLSIAIFNLYPVCASCNLAKKDEEYENYFELYKEQTEPSPFKFKLNKASKALFLTTRNCEDLEVIFNSQFGDILNINKIYNEHQDIAEEIILKRLAYNEEYRKTLNKLCKKHKITKPMIKRFILGNYTEEREIHKRPFAKFMQDIGKEVGLIE